MLPVCERPGGGGRLGAGRFREGNGEIHHHPRHWTIRRLADPHRREPLHRLPAPTLAQLSPLKNFFIEIPGCSQGFDFASR